MPEHLEGTCAGDPWVCFALLCNALLCFALHRFALLCFAVLCFALLWFALLCFALHCFALLCFALMLHMVLGTPSCRPARIDPQDFHANDLSQQVKYRPCRYEIAEHEITSCTSLWKTSLNGFPRLA